ncbi:phage portal protein [Clostridium botulinum]|uniref:phage portal protein n=2 Tax=Clostridium botulinum TaxID=1491 RepID=UPI0007744066|nr:phage portal protein [Clostridium botulinum]MBN1079220.1 phage portal protein [Clostridium botulinum]
MNIFRRFFNRSPSKTRFELIEDKGNGFYTWNGNIYKSDIVRACVRPKVKAIGKLIPQHLRNNKEDGFIVNPEVYIKFLLEEPNPYMSGQVFLEKMAMQLALNNNAFALIVKDENGYPIEMYNIQCSGVEAIYDNIGLLHLRFYNSNGKTVTYPYTDIIHIRQDINENDIFGESLRDALLPLMNVITTTDQGIINAVKNGGIIRWLLKFNQALRPEDIKKQTDEFTESFLSSTKSGGAAGIDTKVDATQVDPKDYVPNAAQMDRTTKRIYSLFNTNEKIVQSNYKEDEWNAYYESEIEPLAMQLSNEYTRKIFTRRERGFGNKIVFTANNLQYASMSTKLELRSMVDRGAMTPNEWREVLNLPPVKDGDKIVRRLDTEVVKGDDNK